MAFDLTGRALSPLGDLIPTADFPLAEFIPTAALNEVFDRFSYTDATVYRDGLNLVIDAQFVWEGELSLAPPGTDAIALVVGSAGVGMTTARARLVLGPDFSLSLQDLSIGLRVSQSVLKDVASGGPAEISVTGDVTFAGGRISVNGFTEASLPPAYLCGTEIIVEAAKVRVVFGAIDPPEFIGDQEDFQGLTFEKLSVFIPSSYLELDSGSSLIIEIANAAIGTTGFTGAVSVDADPAHPVTGKLLGFPFRFRQFRLDVQQNALLDASLDVDLRLEALEDGAEKWVGVDLAFGSGGDVSGALSAVQPPEAEGTPDALVTVHFAGVATFDLTGLRVTRVDGVWSLYFSGAVQLFVPGADWPKIAFDEIGVSSAGEILIADGGGIAFATPLVVDWHFATLCISKFRFAHAEGSDTKLQIALAAQIVLVEGVPAGAAVDGLIVEWTPGSGAAPDVRFEGIEVAFGVPGSFFADLEVAYRNDGGTVQFVGEGKLELPALDASIDVSIVVGRQVAALPEHPEAFVYLYLFADAKLMPAGIPIGSTGLAIYGFQGLVAYQMKLDVNEALPADERFYALFIADPVGINAASKWVPKKGKNAIGAGIVLGTMDKGYAINAKGMLVVAFPDLTILLQARANFLKKRPGLDATEEGALDALMVYSAGASTLSLDIVAHWEISSIVSVTGAARAFFSFDDPDAWYLEIGRDEDGKRVLAQALKWNGEWLFSAGFWIRLDAEKLVTGVQVEIDVHKSRGGFYVDVKGKGRAQMTLFWEPLQWEGMLELSGRISAGYKGISVGLSLEGDARARVKRPFDVHLHVKACIEALFWEVCKSFDFDWKSDDPPILEVPFRRATATPRHWTPLRIDGPPEQVETGVATLEGVPGLVQPHSQLAIDFAKPMVDVTGAFNEAVSLPDEGFLTIGEGSGYAAAYRLESVELLRDPDGAREAVELWGTWARETLEPNTTLRLLSSERFDDDGSLSDGYVAGEDVDYCAAPEPSSYCVTLAGVTPVYDTLDDGSLTELIRAKGTATSPEGVILGQRERLTIRCRKKLERAKVVARDADGNETPIDVLANPPGVFTLLGKRLANMLLVRFCYPRGHGTLHWPTASVLGGIQTGTESWNVPPDVQILRPNETYELVLAVTPRMMDPDGDVSDPLGTGITIERRFQTDGPPDYPGALQNYVADTYPSDGKRPAYTDYDLVVRFLERYVFYLYASVEEPLAIRLFDGQGRPVLDEGGAELLVPVEEPGPEEVSPTLVAWEDLYAVNEANGCVGPLPAPTPAPTVGRIPSPALTPNSQYVAQLVSIARPAIALATWGFTTSSFATFTALVTTGRESLTPRAVAADSTAAGFDAFARDAGIDSIAYAQRFRVTPLFTADGTACAALLLEAPEPLEAGQRLSIAVDGAATTLTSNVDGTRVFVRPAGGGTFAKAVLGLTLTWRRNAGAVLPVLAIAGNSADEVVSFDVDAGAPT